jgi:hypothetical protein
MRKDVEKKHEKESFFFSSYFTLLLGELGAVAVDFENLEEL